VSRGGAGKRIESRARLRGMEVTFLPEKRDAEKAKVNQTFITENGPGTRPDCGDDRKTKAAGKRGTLEIGNKEKKPTT